MNYRHSIASLCLIPLLGCSGVDDDVDENIALIEQAFRSTETTFTQTALPKVPYPISTAARLEFVDSAMSDPRNVITAQAAIVRQLKSAPSEADLLTDITSILKVFRSQAVAPRIDTTVSDITGHKELDSLIRSYLLLIDRYSDTHDDMFDDADESLLDSIKQGLHSSKDTDRRIQQFNTEEIHRFGARFDIRNESSSLVDFIRLANRFSELQASTLPTGTWETSHGIIKIAGADDDEHSGEFLLLIDIGGNDKYTDVANTRPHTSSMVVDLAGDDIIRWHTTTGPGTGMLNNSIWLDVSGNDRYEGTAVGLGTGLFGSGALIDRTGDDVYDTAGFSIGAGQYGIGYFEDGAGDDIYLSDYNSQGYAGNGSIGILVDRSGDDRYECRKTLPDLAENRVKRHLYKHYISMCQAFSYGTREDYSGGIGLLLDGNGHDWYKIDMLGQGGAYWFGAGILIDVDGDDEYSGFEHVQGEALHLAAGYLFDHAGNDRYSAFEHAQGTGIDRAIGFLLDKSGNDTYTAQRESQGAGIKPYGVGILQDNKGDDSYHAGTSSQGYTSLQSTFPAEQWPSGFIIDGAGKDAVSSMQSSDPKTDRPTHRNGHILLIGR